jgi:hypothetical protein
MGKAAARGQVEVVREALLGHTKRAKQGGSGAEGGS